MTLKHFSTLVTLCIPLLTTSIRAEDKAQHDTSLLSRRRELDAQRQLRETLNAPHKENHKTEVSNNPQGQSGKGPDQTGDGPVFRLQIPNKWQQTSPDQADYAFAQPVVKDPVLNARVSRDKRTGHVVQFVGHVAVGKQVSPKEVSDVFLKTHHALFGLSEDLSDLSFFAFSPWKGGGGVSTYNQTFQGLPVFGGELTVVTNGIDTVYQANSALKSISGSIAPIHPDSDAAVAAASHAAAKDIGLTPQALKVTGTPRAELGVIVRKESPSPVWKVRFSISNPRTDLEAMVDAISYDVQTIRSLSEN